MQSRTWFTSLALVGALAFSSAAAAREIVVGQTMPYSGNASMASAIGKLHQQYFKWINANGGINGHTVRFVTLDDGMSPGKSLEQTRRLVESEKVEVVFAPYGTAPSLATRRYLNQKMIPQLFVVSGVSAWADPAFKYSIGWMPNYSIETSVHAQLIQKNVPDPKIAVLYQNDDFGKEMLQGIRRALGPNADKMIVATASYESADATVNSQVAQLKASGANVLLNYSLPRYAAQAIRNVDESGWKPFHILSQTSTSIAQVMKPVGFDKAQGLVAAQYNKDATDARWKDDAGVREFREWMTKHYPEGDQNDAFNVFAYNLAKSFEQVLRQCGNDFSANNIMKQAMSLDLELNMLMPGIKVKTGANDPLPIQEMQPIRFTGQNWVPLGGVVSGK